MSQPETDTEITPIAPMCSPCSDAPCVVRASGRTDLGQVRKTNEDQFLVAELARTMRVHATSLPDIGPRKGERRGHVLLVADGMGGHQAGEVASALTVVTVEEFLLDSLKRFACLDGEEQRTLLDEFRAAVREADARLFEEVSRHPELRGMGTTLTLAFATDWTLFVAHAGDSRCYLYSAGQLRQVTRDHTLAAELTRRGALTPEEAATSRGRHVLTNALGGKAQGVAAELHKRQLVPGDMVLVCSDGLSGMVSDERIAALLAAETDPDRLCEQLIAEANAAGGKDNITVVIARFDVK